MTFHVDQDVLEGLELITEGDSDRFARILRDLQDLKLEPEPSKQGWRLSSSRVEFFLTEGLEVRSLTLKTNLPGYRFFYHFDGTHDVVYVMEIAKRNKKTYDPLAPHVERIRVKYEDYYGRQRWLQW